MDVGGVIIVTDGADFKRSVIILIAIDFLQAVLGGILQTDEPFPVLLGIVTACVLCDTQDAVKQSYETERCVMWPEQASRQRAQVGGRGGRPRQVCFRAAT